MLGDLPLRSRNFSRGPSSVEDAADLEADAPQQPDGATLRTSNDFAPTKGEHRLLRRMISRHTLAMAERALPAFGRYVKMLRERRGLSLDDAATLTRVYPSPLNKGYVSRVERGLTRVGFEKMIAIARAYEVPVDVLAERLWLDLELDTTGPPETHVDEIQAMFLRAGRAASRGLLWQAYAHVRDALPLGLNGPVSSRFTDRREQTAICCTNLGASAMKLGALKFALHEMKFARELLADNSKHAAMVAIHLANLSRRLNNVTAARVHADDAISKASNSDSSHYAGYAHAARGMIAHEEKQFVEAIEEFRRSIAAFRAAELQRECPTILLNIAQTYFSLARSGAAKRSLASAQRLAAQYSIDQVQVRSRILLGEILEVEGKQEKALRLWREAADLARQSRDRTLVFKADFLIYRSAIHARQLDLARAVGKKLRRLAPWVMPDIPELHEFQTLVSQHPEVHSRHRRVVN